MVTLTDRTMHTTRANKKRVSLISIRALHEILFRAPSLVPGLYDAANQGHPGSTLCESPGPPILSSLMNEPLTALWSRPGTFVGHRLTSCRLTRPGEGPESDEEPQGDLPYLRFCSFAAQPIVHFTYFPSYTLYRTGFATNFMSLIPS